MKVLLVEDDRLSQRVATMLLEDMGCEVTVVGSIASGREAISSKFDLVFLDLGLPDGDGLSLIDDFEKLERLPKIVILTGHVIDRRKYLELPIDDFLQKPVIVAELERVMFRLLKDFTSLQGCQSASNR